MTFEQITDAELGASLRLAALSGVDPRSLASFAMLRSGMESLDSATAALGVELTQLISSGAELTAVGRFVRLRLDLGLHLQPSHSTSSTLIEQGGMHSPSMPSPALVDAIIGQLQVRGVRPTKSPIRRRIPIRISVNKTPTNITLDPDIVHAFIAKFGRPALTTLAKEITRNEPPLGHSRSYQVEQAMRSVIARSDISNRSNVRAFPSAI